MSGWITSFFLASFLFLLSSPLQENKRIDEVEFNTLMVWLDSLDKTGVQVLQADISESGGAGQVKVRRLQLGKS